MGITKHIERRSSLAQKVDCDLKFQCGQRSRSLALLGPDTINRGLGSRDTMCTHKVKTVLTTHENPSFSRVLRNGYMKLN